MFTGMMLTTSRPGFIDQLQFRLMQQPLPGTSAHLEMAHAVRRVEPVVDPAKTREAAVLMTLFEKTPGDWHLVFIRRSASHSRDKHAGQIGFPGGKKEAADPDLMFTALREAHEETGLDLTTVEVLGQLTPLYITVSRFLVHPYLAWVPAIPTHIMQQEEVEEVLEFPLHHFLKPFAPEHTQIRLQSGMILNHVPCFQVGDHTIWGATAMILNELLTILRNPHP